MRAAALTMVHDELSFVKLWLKHYEPIVGRENIYVIVHGNNAAVIDFLKGCNLIPYPRHNVDWKFDALRFAFLNAYANILINNYDVIIGGDVDELVFVDPKISNNLIDFVAQFNDRPILTALGFHLCEHPQDDALVSDVPLFSQRKIAFVDSDYCKPLVAFQNPLWSRGYHASAHQPFMPAGLFMAHLKFVSQDISNDVTQGRKLSFAENASLAATKSRSLYWGAGEVQFRRVKRSAGQAVLVDWDTTYESLLEDYRSSVVQNYASRGGFSLRSSKSELHRLKIPDRFSDVL